MAHDVQGHVQSARNNADSRPRLETIHVIATTISGSIQDQRKVHLIGPAFQARTSRQIHVHVADSHDEVRAVAHDLVAKGARTIVSAGGSGTFNAVLEGVHLGETVPSDLRLGFLRKGSADVLGKVLNIPDQVPSAVQALLEGIESDRIVWADVLTVETVEPCGQAQRRHITGFGGVGIFGEVPRFTESRLIKVYKGVLGTLFGDLGPFYVGLACATVSWQLQRIFGCVSPMHLTMDDEQISPQTWATVFILNGDLGPDLPLGQGLALGSGTFRVIAVRYGGLGLMLRQILAARSGKLLAEPENYGAVVRTARRLTLRPAADFVYLVNVDGTRLITRGEVRIFVSDKVRLISAAASQTCTLHPSQRNKDGEAKWIQ